MSPQPLRMVFATDIHNAFGAVRALLEQTQADVTVLGGDLVSRAFHRHETAWRFMEAAQTLRTFRTTDRDHRPLYDLARDLRETHVASSVRTQAREYLRLSDLARRYLERAYAALEEIFAQFPGRLVYVLPGNYDMDLRETVLVERNLHLSSVKVKGWTLAGYGGAGVETQGMPDHLQVRFAEGEAARFLEKVQPEILALHEPPYGMLDRIHGAGSAGSEALRGFVEAFGPRVVLSGHYHESWGVHQQGRTCVYNPSNFGPAETATGTRPGGTFLDVILDTDGSQVGTLRRVERGGLRDILDYRFTEKGLDALILDEARYARLGGRLPPKRHIGPIRNLQHIRSFFLAHETEETMRLVRELRGVYREIGKQGMEVAFDLLGSVSFGMAEKGSDMDLVVYLRGRDCRLDDLDTCGIPRPLAAVFDALKARKLHIEVCDSLDLDRIRQAIEKEDHDDGQLQRFVFYRIVCRPVNLRLIKAVENLLLEKEPFRRRVEEALKDYLDVLVSSVRHVQSFDKYRQRLRERGIPLAPDVEDAIRHYLRG